MWPSPFDASTKSFVFESNKTVAQALSGEIALLLSGLLLCTRRYSTSFLSSTVAATLFYYSGKQFDLRYAATSGLFAMLNAFGVLKSFELAVLSYRKCTPTRVDQDAKGQSVLSKQAMWYAYNALADLRGIGWEWGSPGRYPAYPANEWTFLVSLLVKLDVSSLALSWLARTQPRDTSFSSRPVYFQVLLPLLVGFCMIALFEFGYGVLRAVAVHCFRQDRKHWPLLLDYPFNARTLREFWSQKWHQLFRRTLSFDSQVLSSSLLPWTSQKTQKQAALLMVFALSGVLHDFGFWFFCGRSDSRNIFSFCVQSVFILFQNQYLQGCPDFINRLYTVVVLIATVGRAGIVAAAFEVGVFEDPLLGNGILISSWKALRQM